MARTTTGTPYQIYAAAAGAVERKSLDGETLTEIDLRRLCPHLTAEQLNELFSQPEARIALPPLCTKGGFRGAIWQVNPLGGIGPYCQANTLRVLQEWAGQPALRNQDYHFAAEAAAYAEAHWPDRLRTQEKGE